MKNRNIFLLGSIGFIVLAIGFISILDRIKTPNDVSTDVRARAAVTNALMINATVESIDQDNGIIQVADAYISDVSRSGEAKNLGNWTVTSPPGFNYSSIKPGMNVTIGVNSKSFLVSKHTLTAISIVPAN